MKCQHCGKEGAERRRQMTEYADDQKNWAILCDKCQEEADEHWKDMWDEYYSMVL